MTVHVVIYYHGYSAGEEEIVGVAATADLAAELIAEHGRPDAVNYTVYEAEVRT